MFDVKKITNKKRIIPKLVVLVSIVSLLSVGSFLLYNQVREDDASSKQKQVGKLGDESAVAAENGNYDLAIKKTIEIFNVTKNGEEKSAAATRIGNYYFAKGDAKAADAWLDRAIATYREIGNEKGIQSTKVLKQKLLSSDEQTPIVPNEGIGL